MPIRPLSLVLVVLASALAQPGRIPELKAPAQPPDPFRILERFGRMSPQQRQRFLSKLPPERKKQFENRLNRYERMTPEQRQRVREQYELFQGLPKERQEALRRTFREFSELPPRRRRILRGEYLRLRDVPEADRRTRVTSEEFRNRYSPEEQRILEDFAKYLPPPKTPPPNTAQNSPAQQ